ncbi:hypothetical protein SUGI_0296850 [Cryptomeria japonica]|nr:hypothetical protein SUGI_0296850 [Cryptomeria japonica]
MMGLRKGYIPNPLSFHPPINPPTFFSLYELSVSPGHENTDGRIGALSRSLCYAFSEILIRWLVGCLASCSVERLQSMTATAFFNKNSLKTL